MIPIFNKQATFIGIAIHDDKISLAKLKSIKKKLTLEAHSVIPLSTEAAVNEWQPILKEWVCQHQVQDYFAALALPASHVIYKRIRLAACLGDLECEAEIAANLQQYVPTIHEPLHFDFLPIARNEQEIELQLIAARSQQLVMYCDAVYGTGLKIQCVDVDSHAAVRAVNFILSDKLSGLVLKIDAAAAQCIFLKNGNVFSVYSIALDKNNALWPQIQKKLQTLSGSEAMDRMKNIFLLGDLSYLSDLKKRLLEEYVQVEIIDSLKEKIETTCHFVVSENLTALGLALRGCQYV